MVFSSSEGYITLDDLKRAVRGGFYGFRLSSQESELFHDRFWHVLTINPYGVGLFIGYIFVHILYRIVIYSYILWLYVHIYIIVTSLTIDLQHLHVSIRNANQELPDEEIHKLWKAIGSLVERASEIQTVFFD